MNLEPRIHLIAAALADRSRASMICALLDGRAYTAKELACLARITPPTATQHLKVLEREGLITRLKSGRSTYVRLASADVARVVESLAVLSSTDHVARIRPRGATPAMLTARRCYDHLAGQLGVTLADRLGACGHVTQTGETMVMTDQGRRFFDGLGIDTTALESARRPTVRACLDWTERRHHIAGGLGAALMALTLDNGWLAYDTASRAMLITGTGREALACHFGIADLTAAA